MSESVLPLIIVLLWLDSRAFYLFLTFTLAYVALCSLYIRSMFALCDTAFTQESSLFVVAHLFVKFFGSYSREILCHNALEEMHRFGHGSNSQFVEHDSLAALKLFHGLVAPPLASVGKD